MNFKRNRFRAKNSIFMLGSVLLHLLLVLCISNLFAKKPQRPDQFDLNAIKVSNLAKAAKKKAVAKAGKKSKSQPKKRAKLIPKKKATVTTKRVAKSRTTVKTKSPQLQAKKWQNVTQKQADKQLKRIKPTIQRQVVVKRQMQYQSRENQPVKLTQKRVVYKQQTKNVNRRSIEKPTLFRVTEPVKTQQRVNKVSTLKRVVNKTEIKTRQIQTRVWQQNVTQKQADKQLKRIKPTIQRQVVVKRQMQYQSRENQPVKLTQKRVVYKRKTKNLDRRPIEKPEPLELTKQVEVIEKVTDITRFRQVTKKTTRVTRVEALPMLKDNLALEKIHLKTDIKKGTKQVKITSRREVTTIKQIAYEERASSSEPIKVSQRKVVYQQEITEQTQEVKAIDAPDIPTEVTPTETEAAMVSLTNIAKQTYENSPAEAYTVTSITQVTTDFSENSQNTVEKASTFTNTTARNNTMTQHKLDIQRTDDSQGELVAFNDIKATQSNSFSNPLADLSTDSSDSEVAINVDLPYGNTTGIQLYRVTGTTDAGVKTAFLTINDITQLVTVVDGSFIAEVALSTGTNNLSIIAFNGKGKKGLKSFQLLFNPPKGGIPRIRLDSPKNGRQGVKQGEQIVVEGTIDDYSITKATLLLNRTPIPLEVKNGRFHKRINLPAGTIFAFRIMAKNQNGVRGFSPVHTVLSDSKVDILNPRPY